MQILSLAFVGHTSEAVTLGIASFQGSQLKLYAFLSLHHLFAIDDVDCILSIRLIWGVFFVVLHVDTIVPTRGNFFPTRGEKDVNL